MNDVKKLVKKACQEGWSIEHGTKHIKLRHSSGALVVVSRSASDRRTARNIQGDLRRAKRIMGVK